MEPALLSATAAPWLAELWSAVLRHSLRRCARTIAGRHSRPDGRVHEDRQDAETLYAEFISEAARRLVEAWSHQAQGPEVVGNLYGAVERMRLTSSERVIRGAESVIQMVIEAYAEPDRSFEELRERLDDLRTHDQDCPRSSWRQRGCRGDGLNYRRCASRVDCRRPT